MTLADKFFTMADITTIEEAIDYFHKNKYIDNGMQLDDKMYLFFFTDASVYFSNPTTVSITTKDEDPATYKTMINNLEEAKKENLKKEILSNALYTLAYSFEAFLHQHSFTGFDIAAAANQFKKIELIDREVLDERISFIGFIDHSIYVAVPGEGSAIFHEDDIDKLIAIFLELKEGTSKDCFAALKKIEADNVRPPQKETA